jgi:hypothetical protein
MSGACIAGILALALAARGEPSLPPAAPGGEPGEEPADEAGAADEVDPADGAEAAADEELSVASLSPEAFALAPAPRGLPLAEAAPVLLERRERPDGTALERLVEPSGEVVLHEVSRAGTVLSCRTVGRLLTLRVLEQREAAGGEVVQVARDASGALLRFVVGADGEPRAVAVIAPAPR